MKNNYITTLTIILVIVFSLPVNGQNANTIWNSISQINAKQSKQVFRKISPKKESFYSLDVQRLKFFLINAGTRAFPGNVIISLPNSSGELNKYRVFEASIMEPELQAKFPDMKTYAGQGIDNPTETVRFSITPKGFHAMILGSSNGSVFIDPYSIDGNVYSVYAKKDLKTRDFDFECGVDDNSTLNKINQHSNFAKNADDGILRDYRIAIACTGEYAAFHGGTVSGAMAAMVVTMNRVNGVYERDLSVTMTMVDNTSIIYTDGSTDPFNNNSAGILINQSQTEINSTIGSANYDIGHTFSTGGGGLAGLGVTCNNANKARGITGSPQPTGDPFDIDFVAHELGHQFGAPHTFNGNQGNCAGGNRSSANAYEPGSGTTIMAYAGICGTDNVQNNSDAYFHQNSLDRMWTHILSTGACPLNRTNTGNTEPTADAGADYTIPQGTPYKLDGSNSTDPDGISTLTYTWEQYDLGPSGVPIESTVSGPLVRSFEGTSDPTRYVPRLADILVNGGTSTTWEKLSTVNRNINYRLTVRDNDSRGGQTDVDQMTASVTTAAGPFVITSQNTSGQSWDVGATETITWDVAGTTGNGVNESNVNILLSTDGLNYDTVLASNVPNDGSHDVIVPNVSSLRCRIMVEAVNGIFFNINTKDIVIGAAISCNNLYESGIVSEAIPDGNGIITPDQGTPLFNSINVPNSFSIESVSVSVDISHTALKDFIIQLQHPDVDNNNAFVNIYVGECGFNDDLMATFEDGAISLVCDTPTSGTFSPSNALNTFQNLDAQGDWNIVIVDFFQGNAGTLNSWSLSFCTTQPLSLDDEELIGELKIHPNPNSGEFNIEFNSNTSENIIIEVFDIRGRVIFMQNYNAVSRFEEVIRLNNAQSGIYMLSISDGSQKVIKKIIVD